MSKFAKGSYAYGISDRSGFRYRLKDMRKEWNGLLVGKDEYEDKHPQLNTFKRAADSLGEGRDFNSNTGEQQMLKL